MGIGWKRGLWLVAVACLLASAGLVIAADTANVSGAWNITWQGRQGTRTATANFEQKGEELTGTFAGPTGQGTPLTGSVKGNDITFSISMSTQRGDFTLTYTGTVDGDSMKGTLAVGENSIEWTGERAK